MLNVTLLILVASHNFILVLLQPTCFTELLLNVFFVLAGHNVFGSSTYVIHVSLIATRNAYLIWRCQSFHLVLVHLQSAVVGIIAKVSTIDNRASTCLANV